MPRLLSPLTALVLTAGLVALLPGKTQADAREVTMQAQTISNGMAKALRVLREDIDIDLPDARGVALGDTVDRCVQSVRQIQRATRSGAAQADIHKLAIALDKELDRLVAEATRLGSDGYYLRKSAAQINAQNEQLARIVAPVTIPPQVFVLTGQIAKGLRALHDDIDIDLPDARGQGLSNIADRALMDAQRIFRGVRFGAPPTVVRAQIVELTTNLHKLEDAAGAIGTDAYYVRKSANRLHAISHELLKTMGPKD